MHRLAHTLDRLDDGPIATFENLSMLPLVAREPGEPIYVTLDEALPTGRFRITEVSEQGSVPELRVQNDLDTPVLLLDGEELVGAKQNRVVNLTILVPAHATITIPVSCVEAGRWRHATPEFLGSPRAQFREGRARKVSQVTAALKSTARPASDQGDVWACIDERAQQLQAHAPSRAMSDVYKAREHTVDEYVRAMRAVEGQCGAAFAINGRLAGVEIFDAPRTLAGLLPKIVSSYALDAIVATAGIAAPAFAPAFVRKWLDAVSRVRTTSHPGVGLGESIRWDAPGLTAAALALDSRLVHFVGFPLEHSPADDPGGSRRRYGMRAASARRGGPVM
jgi:hypothetical protein